MAWMARICLQGIWAWMLAQTCLLHRSLTMTLFYLLKGFQQQIQYHLLSQLLILPNQDQVFNRLPTGVQLQPRVSINLKDSSDASRGKKKKRYCHDYSRSSSEELPDRTFTQSQVMDRNRSPPPQKMQIVTGKGDLTWESFIYRFEWTASRRCWDETKKTSRLFDCLKSWVR